MKQKIALLLALLLSVSMITNLTACKKTEDGSEPSATEPSASESTEPSEPTPPATLPTEDYKDDIAYYPFPLLNMTYEEIKQQYGLQWEKVGQGCAPYYSLKMYPEIQVQFIYEGEYYNEQTNPVPPDLWPNKVETDGNVYPGIKTGMKYSEIDFQNIPNHELIVGNSHDITTFTIYEKIEVEEYTIYAYMGVCLHEKSDAMPANGAVLPWKIVEKYLGYHITEQEAFEKVRKGDLTIQKEDILEWLKDGHMDEIADIEITSIEIYRN